MDITTEMFTIKDNILLCLHRTMLCYDNGSGIAKAVRKFIMQFYDVIHDHERERNVIVTEQTSLHI